MVAIRIVGPTGIKPRTSDRLLPDNAATVAANCIMTSGELRPVNVPILVSEPTKDGPFVTIYKSEAGWFTWPYDVDIARSPLPGDQKFVFTGDGEPRTTNVALATHGGNNDYPNQYRALGVPSPKTAPSVTASGGTGAVVSRYYVYTFYDDWNQESGPSPLSALVTGKVDSTWAITNMDDSPANSGTGTAAFSAGLTTFTNSGSAKHWLRVGDQVVIAGETVAVVEVVSPSVFKIPGDFTGATSWARKAPFGPCTKRLYRTSGSTAQFQLVAEGITAANYNDTLTDGQILGDELITADWDMPPTNLRGIITLPSGVMCGFYGKTLCFSEPYQIHAWPAKYQLRVDYPIVGVETFSTNVAGVEAFDTLIVAATTGNPFIITGSEPGQMVVDRVNVAYPCLSKRSVVSLGASVGYASSVGFVSVGLSGASVITQPWYSTYEWTALSPSEMIACVAKGRLYLTFDDGTRNIMVFDFVEPQQGMTVLYIKPTDIYTDPAIGEVYCAVTGADGVSRIYRLPEEDTVFTQLDWQSKTFVFPEPVNLGACKVVFNSKYTRSQYDSLWAAYQAALAENAAKVASGYVRDALNEVSVNDGNQVLNGSDILNISPPNAESPGVNITVYGNGEIVLDKYLPTSPAVFRLPSGYKADTFAIRVRGQVIVKSIELAESMIGLKQA